MVRPVESRHATIVTKLPTVDGTSVARARNVQRATRIRVGEGRPEEERREPDAIRPHVERAVTLMGVRRNVQVPAAGACVGSVRSAIVTMNQGDGLPTGSVIAGSGHGSESLSMVRSPSGVSKRASSPNATGL